MNLTKIPRDLIDRRAWVMWKGILRDGKLTKIPFQTNGSTAKSTDPSTWTSFDEVSCVSGYSGIGYVFSSEDPFCGIDLDGARNPETGEVAEWAKDIIAWMDTYAEVSPSKAGVKLFLRGKLPFATGKKKELPNITKTSDKTPAIEVYDHGRYFAVTGLRLKGPTEPQERQSQLDEVLQTYFPNEPAAAPGAPPQDFRSEAAVIERARKYIAKMPPAVSGQDGHGRTFRVACILVMGFGLPEADAMGLMHEYNQGCQPAWSEKELLHKVRCAGKQTGERGYLRNVGPDRWQDVPVPTNYQESAGKPEPRQTTLLDATRAYVDRLRTGESTLIGLGIPDLDYAIGGGVEKGEMVILAARPSHGKSAVGLQCIHHWTSEGRPCAIVSEEMAALALGKRSLQFMSDIPEEHWYSLLPGIDKQVDEYAASHAPCIVLEGCGTAETAREAIVRAVEEHKVECVVVDYAQLLGAPGKGRYEQMTNMSVTLRQLASSQKIVLLALCQMSRAIETRTSFNPEMSDLKETGQLEQDADVIMFLCWPHRLDASEPENKFQFFIKKNRNRGINQAGVTSRFIPSRQKITDAPSETSYVPNERTEHWR